MPARQLAAPRPRRTAPRVPARPAARSLPPAAPAPRTGQRRARRVRAGSMAAPAPAALGLKSGERPTEQGGAVGVVEAAGVGGDDGQIDQESEEQRAWGGGGEGYTRMGWWRCGCGRGKGKVQRLCCVCVRAKNGWWRHQAGGRGERADLIRKTEVWGKGWRREERRTSRLDPGVPDCIVQRLSRPVPYPSRQHESRVQVQIVRHDDRPNGADRLRDRPGLHRWHRPPHQQPVPCGRRVAPVEDEAGRHGTDEEADQALEVTDAQDSQEGREEMRLVKPFHATDAPHLHRQEGEGVETCDDASRPHGDGLVAEQVQRDGRPHHLLDVRADDGNLHHRVDGVVEPARVVLSHQLGQVAAGDDSDARRHLLQKQTHHRRPPQHPD
eukprot:scaffold1419_cov95-Isochrysis_galbana.AAC.3